MGTQPTLDQMMAAAQKVVDGISIEEQRRSRQARERSQVARAMVGEVKRAMKLQMKRRDTL